MRKFGKATILDILDRAKKEFTYNTDSLYYVKFSYRDHLVFAYCDPVSNDFGWIVSSFKVIYPRCIMTYILGVDYSEKDAYFYD